MSNALEYDVYHELEVAAEGLRGHYIGDIVNYNGKLYKSLINGNVYSPDTYPQGWEIYTED